jgi:hypothetical protein
LSLASLLNLVCCKHAIPHPRCGWAQRHGRLKCAGPPLFLYPPTRLFTLSDLASIS